jgi:hypothetical protein
MDRHDEASRADYEQLRRHLQRPRPEHPAGRQTARVAPRPVEPTERFSVMEWLVAVGGAVARKLRRSRSAMVRVHPED